MENLENNIDEVKTVYSASISFKGMKKKQRKIQSNYESLGDFEVSEQGIEQAREAAMQWIKDNVKQSMGSIDLILTHCKLDGYFRSWEMFGKDNKRIQLGSLERIKIKEELAGEV